jgi:hypothetical protein
MACQLVEIVAGCALGDGKQRLILAVADAAVALARESGLPSMLVE